MTYVFSDEQKAAARNEKKRLLWMWIALLIVTVAIIVTLITVDVYMVEIKLNRSFTLLFGAIAAVAGVGFSCFSLFFFAIKYRLTRKYVAMLKNMDRGLKDKFDAKFLGYDDHIETKDGVNFYSMVLKTRPLRRDDIDERKLLIEYTIPKLELSEGTKLKLISHANILVAYEIVENTAASEIKEQNADVSEDTTDNGKETENNGKEE